MAKTLNEDLGRLSLEDFKQTPKNSFIVILDDVRSLHNVGSAFRTCDAFLAEKLLLCGITGTPPDREIRKTALGAEESVIWEHHKNILELVAILKSENYKLVVIEQADNATKLQQFDFLPAQKYAFVFGNEVFGVKEELVNMADVVVEIPQFGTKHSINISVSIGIVLWEYIKRIIQ
jgi:tRNA G18 (ribose-2'-O)-methylase SpoU